MENFIREHLWTILYIIWFTTLAVLLVMEKRNPAKTLAWLTVLAAFPVVGFIVYLVFGQKYRKHKRLQAKSLPEEFSNALRVHASRHEKRTEKISTGFANQDKWMRLLWTNSRSPVTENNRIQVLQDGKEAFRSMCEALRQAEHHIHLEFYIMKDDEIGRAIQQILVEKARQGVQVRVIYDAVGSRKLKNSYIDELKRAGVQITSFLPVYFPWLSSRINFRNHRKIIVIDGKIGYTGGLNIGDEYLGKGPLGYWRDTHMRIEGDAVYYLQFIFLKDWYVAYNQYISETEYFPVQESVGKSLVQMAASGPDTDWESIWQTHFSLIASAQRKICIISPYLIPDESILMGLKTAALSGLDVRMILPSQPEYYIVYYATKSYYEELLRAGVRIYAYTKGFIHSKVIIVDDQVASVGTANLDVRSFQYNFEVNAIIYDGGIAQQLMVDFEKDLQDSDELLLDHYLQHRGSGARFLESTVRLFSPLL